MTASGGTPLLAMEGVRVTFSSRDGPVRAVDTVDLALDAGDHLALIGESGCGKTVLGMSVPGLLPANAEIAGEIRYDGRDLRRLPQRSLQEIRGKEIALVPQNSGNVLNPVQEVGRQIGEPLRVHRLADRKSADGEALRLLGALGFEDPARAARQYPHEFSGGMRERILIAMAMICSPRLLIADEPTSGLDVPVKREILRLMKQQVSGKRALLLITHDLGAATFLCTRTAVMYAGEIVESGTTHEVLAGPMHPYTLGLLASLPSAGLHPIPGTGPSHGNLPAGCRFSPRCPAATEQCRRGHPPLMPGGGTRQVRCWRYA